MLWLLNLLNRAMPPAKKLRWHVQGPPPGGRWPIVVRNNSKYRPSGGFFMPGGRDGNRSAE